MLFNKYLERIKSMFNKEKIVSFLEKQGFYIVLFICIFIIGITALLTSGKESYLQNGVDGNNSSLKEIGDKDLSSDSEKDGQDLEDINIEIKDVITDDNEEEQEGTQVSDSFNSKSPEHIDTEHSENKQGASNVFEEIKQEDNDIDQIVKEDNNKHNEVENKDNNMDVKSTISQQEVFEITMIHPVEGEVIKEYSMDKLIYSNTLKEWTTHPGMDIESFLGAEVKAAMGGIVEKVEEDPLMGIVITLDHGNGIKTRYANLSTASMVKENQEVKAGQVISGIGRTAGVEILDPPHLHFELIIDGKYVNPAEYLK